MSNIDNFLKKTEEAVKKYIPVCGGLLENIPDMLSYSLESGGKRVRPLLCLEFCSALGGQPEKALPFAVAVEFVHTYSLIHDDLPCMDNDDYRRGKLSSHKKFGEANALLAGDALLTHAFNIIASAAVDGTVSDRQAVLAAAELSKLCGVNGMIGGQYIDLDCENKSVGADTLFTMDALKTSALIEAACVLGAVAAEADEKQIAAARDFALALGLAFQITDDILEEKEDGISSDVQNGKSTYVSVFGMEKASALAEEYTEKAIGALDELGENSSELKNIALGLLKREK